MVEWGSFSPLKFITEDPPPSSPGTLPRPRPPLTQDRVPRELHFRHYCQAPLTPFFLPFYLQQLIRVPFALFTSGRRESHSLFPAPPSFTFTTNGINNGIVFFERNRVGGLQCQNGEKERGKKKTTFTSNDFPETLTIRPEPICGRVWRITYPFDSHIMDNVEMFR